MKPKYTKKDQEIRGEIRKGMEIYGYKSGGIAIFLHMSENSFRRRMREPATFKLEELRILTEKLHIDFKELI